MPLLLTGYASDHPRPLSVMTSKRSGHATPTLAGRHWYASARTPRASCSERGGRAPSKAPLLKHARLLRSRLQPANRVFGSHRGRVPLHYKKIRNFWPNSQITHRVAVDSLADRRNQLTNNTLQALHQTFATNQATSQAPQAAPPVRPRRLGDLYYCASASRRAPSSTQPRLADPLPRPRAEPLFRNTKFKTR